MIFHFKTDRHRLQELNWVDKCDYIVDNFARYKNIYLIFDFEPAMFFCHYYLLDGFNDRGFRNIVIQTNVKDRIIMFCLGDTLIWSQYTLRKLKLDIDKKNLPVHFTASDFSLAFICMLEENERVKTKHRKIKNIYKEFKNKIQKTYHGKMID